LAECAEESGEELMMPVQVMSVQDGVGCKLLALLENLLREDLSIADEVGAVADLTEAGMTVEAIADGVGMSAGWVRTRLMLAVAPPPLFAALTIGRVTKEACVEICALPDPAVREEVARRVLEPVARLTPLSAAETRELIEAEYMLPLADVPWEVAEARESGGCAGCANLRPRGRRGAWCVGTGCYRDRMLEEWPGMVDTYPPEYYTALSHEDAAMFWETGALRQDWIDLDSQVPATVLQHFGARTWEEYLEDRLGGSIIGRVMVYLALHPRTNTKRRIVPGGAVRLLLRQNPMSKEPEPEVQEEQDAGEQLVADLVDAEEECRGVAQTMEDDECLGRRRLYEVVTAAEEANAAPFETPAFVRALLRGCLRGMTAAELARWAEVVGCPRDGAEPRLETVHPRLLPGWLAVACCGTAELANCAVHTLEGAS
jgi:hypothetical protein